ncbi:uncharacterized mitochondrial protein AtMg01250-like [Cryptomeria japonica]|uniref:uncharacterized mitochondrial protein AtMg01250-like n=1 Tax=Cryptomeria japonica TaxID=3369 RepID=UPI0027D9EAA5|nr:uncharacterized mitochondrial protein AtMg01250-like [Cryptomeria japonica]
MKSEKIKGVMIKLDVSKAYDRVAWRFLLRFMEKFGFCQGWTEMIKFCISTACFLISANGSLFGFFNGTNGLRQGDPLSSSLFVIMAEALGRAIKASRSRGLWSGINVTNEVITHAQFVDDTTLFDMASVTEAEQIKHTICEYERLSGQVMNMEKSTIYFFNTKPCLQRRMARILGTCIGALPTKNLEAPTIDGVYRSRN